MAADKKQLKAEIKIRKKEAKAKSKGQVVQPAPKRSTGVVRFAEGVRGILYLVLGASLILAVVLGQTGVIITLDDIIQNLIVAQTGKVVLVIIALALLIYGFKNLRMLR